MSTFNYSDYQNVVARAQSGSSNSVKVGFFKLKNDGDEALVRINCGSVEDLEFATVHTVKTAEGRWMRINCLNPLGQYGDTCPLCVASQNDNQNVSKAGKKVYVQLMVSYKDATSGNWSAAAPVIWERPAGFSREIANKLRDFGSLKEHVFKVTRNGKAGDMKTTYSLDYIPVFDKQELIPVDFSAFDNFNIAKHSYWEKTEADIEYFLANGVFPDAGGSAQDAPKYGPNDAAKKIFASKEEEEEADLIIGSPVATAQPAPAAAPKAEEAPAPATRPTRNWSF